MNKKRDGKEKCFDHPVNNQTELNWLRETCEKLDKERVGLTNRLLNTEAELFRLQDENSKLRKREIFHKERQVFLGHQAEELQKLIALRNQEREEILSASATDIQNLIVSQRLHCETLQRLHEEELNHCLQSKRNLECKLNLIDVTQPQEECEKENLEKEHELDLDNPQKTYSNENIKCTQREEPHGNNTNNNNHMHVKNSLADLTKVFLTLNKIHKEVQRQRNLLRLTLQQLGIETPAHIVSPLPAIKGSDFYTTMSSTVQLGEEAFSDICNLREDIAQALTQVLNKSEVKDKDSLKLEILRNQERELFNRRLKEVERDFSEKGNEWKREREHLKARLLDLEVAVEQKKGVQSFRDACVQSSLFSFPKTSSISKNCKNIASQTDMQQGHLSKLELYLDDMRDYINSLERDRSEWQSFAALRTSR